MIQYLNEGEGRTSNYDPVGRGDWRHVLLIIGDYEQCAFSRERPFFMRIDFDTSLFV